MEDGTRGVSDWLSTVAHPSPRHHPATYYAHKPDLSSRRQVRIQLKVWNYLVNSSTEAAPWETPVLRLLVFPERLTRGGQVGSAGSATEFPVVVLYMCEDFINTGG